MKNTEQESTIEWLNGIINSYEEAVKAAGGGDKEPPVTGETLKKLRKKPERMTARTLFEMWVYIRDNKRTQEETTAA